MSLKCGLLAGVAALVLSVGVTPALAGPCVDTTAHGGVSAGCQYLITINANGSASLTDQTGTNGPNYEGSEDVQVGVINNSATALSGLHLTGSDIGDFDGDGIDNYGGGSNAKDTTGYGGPNTYFTNNTIDALDALFVTPLAGGATTFFSLEEPPATGSAGALTVTPLSVPEPAALALFCTALLGLFAVRRQRA